MFNRGGFPGQQPMGHVPMTQPAMSHHGMNMPAMNLSGMNLSGMGLATMNQPGMGLATMNQPNMGLATMNQPNMGLGAMNQPNMNLSGMNHPGINHQLMGPPVMTHQNTGISGINQPNMNLNRMNHPSMNQAGGMGFHQERNNQAFGMRGMDNSGSFGTSDSMGMKAVPIRPLMHTPDRPMGSKVLPQRFASPSVPVRQGQPRMSSQPQEIPSIVNRVVTHASDRLKQNTPLQDPANLMKGKRWENVNVFGNSGREMGAQSIPGGPSLDQVSTPQNRYTNESASSILESFGLSNEDLEELSRYPDDQLTPSNMPGILRDIRLRKMNRTASVPDQAAGRRPGSEAVQSKVIDYGHSSKYKFNDPATPARPRTEQKPPPVSKEPAVSANTKPKASPQKGIGMDNKIPTISGTGKHGWSAAKKDRSNNKTPGGDNKAPVDISVTVPNVESPVILDVAAPVQTELKPVTQDVNVIGQVSYQQPAEQPEAAKGNWVPVMSQEEAQKMKKLPTPSMMNDYYAASPRIFPHICSLCNVECRHLKDWIKHQNNASHIESCRNLQQQYPDWNPQNYNSARNEVKKDEASSKNSKSKSPSPRRARRSGSRNRARKSRSRSPRSSGKRSRSRSRSSRRSRHSPKRSRSPHQGTRSPRSRSPRRYRRSSHSNSPDKRAVDAAVQSFIEATKLKSGEKAKPTKPSNNGKKQPNLNLKNKKPANVSAPKKPGSTSSTGSSSKRPSSNKDSDQKPALPKKASGNSDFKKTVVSTGAKKTTPSNTSGKKQQPNKPQNQHANKANIGKVIHVTNLPDSGYTEQDILKVVQPFGKVCDILIVRAKNEAFMKTNFREAATAAVKFSETTPIMINNQRVTLSLTDKMEPTVDITDKDEKVKEPAKAPAQTATPEKEDTDKKPEEMEVPAGFIKRYKLVDPPQKDSEKFVIVIANLPEGQYTVEEITNLAKPFGGVNDILIVANHRKAYLELTSKNSLDSLLKFYSVFPTYLSGNLLSICVAPRYKDLKNEDLIFAELLEQASYQITPTIYEKFVYLTNLPEKIEDEFEIIRVGLRFGKVEHHVYLSNKNKAILHLHSASAAKAMHSFLSQYPCSIRDIVVQCSVPSRMKLAEEEYMTYLELEKQSTVKNIEKIAPAADKSKEPNEKAVKSDEKPLKNPDEKPIKNTDERPLKPDEKPFEKPDEKTLTKPDEKSLTKPDEKSLTKPDEKSLTKPDEKSLTKPDEKSLKKPDEKSLKKPDKKPLKKPDERTHKKPGERPVKKPDERTQKKPVERSARRPDERSARRPDERSARRPDERSARRPDERSARRPDERSVRKPEERPHKKPEEKPHEKPVKKPDERTHKKPEESPVKKPDEKPHKKEENLSNSEEEVKVKAVSSSPVNMSEIDVDTADDELSAPPLPTKDAAVSDTTSDQDSMKPPIPVAIPSVSVAFATEDDDGGDEDDEEEAAEAPEATDTCPMYVQKEPETQRHEPQPVSHPQTAEELDILVSVESDEEESEEQYPISGGTKGGSQPLSVWEKDTETSADGTSDSPEPDSQSSVQLPTNTMEETKLISPGKSELKSRSLSDEGSRSAEEKSSKDKPGHSEMIRTTKYNAQKGEISVTVTAKSAESRKWTSKERGSSTYESNTQRSNSNRSSPADSSSSHTKSGSSFSQKKNPGKYSSSQSERQSKDLSRSRERDDRSSSRKEDRIKGSSSSRYSRSSRGNNRSPRSKEEEDIFPFNMDEFVTVDEIVEEHLDSNSRLNEPDEKSDTTRRGKRKESDPVPSDNKKSRVTSSGAHERSFVTLDEVCEEEENTATAEDNPADQVVQSLVTLDEVHAEDDPPMSTKEQILMTLDEVSDEEDAQDSPLEQISSTTPEILTKDQLLTLDEVNEEDEEQATTCETTNVEQSKLLESAEDNKTEPEAKTEIQQQKPPANPDHTEHPLLTLDEVKADDDEMPFADIEHRFLTVDEIGEEEEESEAKAENTSKQNPKEPTGWRGRPRKRPLQSDEGGKDSPQQATPETCKGAATKSSPAKTTKSKGSDQGTADQQPDVTAATPDKSQTAKEKPGAETPAKKTKLETPLAEKKLEPFNSNTPVGLEFLVPKTGYFCKLCSLFYMDNSSKLKHCKTLRHYQAVEKHLAQSKESSEEKPSST
ncbi:zinc finger protein 638 isoform X2 [Hyla sarda]|nr:zinc finger protein 638 isoform X2 [Hyla sarda]